MKKTISVLLVISVAFAFAACSSKEYTDTVVTAVVTDENGETVTDSDGNAVTELVNETTIENTGSSADEASSSAGKQAAKSEESSHKSKKTSEKDKKTTESKDKTTAKSGKSDGSSVSASGANAPNGKNNTAKSDEKDTTSNKTKTTTTTQTTTEKPKKREVSVEVVLPYYNDQKTKLSVRYKAEDDKEYSILKIEDPSDKKNELEYEEVTLDGKTVKKYSLGKLKGEVKVVVYFSGMDIMQNSAVIAADESSVKISPATGIAVIEGEAD